MKEEREIRLPQTKNQYENPIKKDTKPTHTINPSKRRRRKEI